MMQTLPDNRGRSVPVQSLNPLSDAGITDGVGHDAPASRFDTPPVSTAFEHLTAEIERGRMRSAAGELANAGTAGF